MSATEATEPEVSEDSITIKPKGWANPPSVGDLKKDLAAAKTSHDAQKAKIQRWLDHLHITGEARIKVPKGNSEVQPKLIRKHAEWRYESLAEPFLAPSSLFTAHADTWEDIEAARQNTLLLNFQFKAKINKIKLIGDYVRAAEDEGTAILKVGWENIEEQVEVERPVFNLVPSPEHAQLHEELAVMLQENPTQFYSEVPYELKIAHEHTLETGFPHVPVLTGETEIVSEIRVRKNAPTVAVTDSKNVVIDPSCLGDPDKVQFIIHSFPTSMAELEKDGRYSNLDKVNITNNSPLSEPDHEENDTETFEFSDRPRKRIIAYEYWGYWDIEGNGQVKPIVATWIGDTLIRLEENPFPDGKPPFVIVALRPVRHSVYGEPDGELLIDNQKIIGAVTRGMIDVMGKSANGQQGSMKGALDATNKRKFQQGQDYEYNPGSDPRAAFHMHQYPEIPNSAQFMLSMQNADAESMTGVKAFATGINAEALGDVARGIDGALSAASKRETGILRRLAEGLTQVARKIVAMNAEFLEDTEIIRVTNESRVAIRREDLFMAADYDLTLDISTAEEDNVKAKELAFMLQTMGGNLDAGIAQLILRDIARLRKMPELAHAIENFEPQQDPLAEERAQLELRLLAAQVAEKESQAAENMAEAALDQARARKENSVADKTDLDFVEQESGVTQEREKEKLGEQARSNIELETHKAALKRRETQETEFAKFIQGNKG